VTSGAIQCGSAEAWVADAMANQFEKRSPVGAGISGVCPQWHDVDPKGQCAPAFINIRVVRPGIFAPAHRK